MAKVAPPPQGKSRKGQPPSITETVGNLNKPEPAGLAPLNFKVAQDFKREFKTYAAQNGVSMTDLLVEGFRLLKEKRGK
jgi:hypothetical protein